MSKKYNGTDQPFDDNATFEIPQNTQTLVSRSCWPTKNRRGIRPDRRQLCSRDSLAKSV